MDNQGRDDNDDTNHYSNTLENPRMIGRICISSNYRKTTYFDEFGFAGLIERARFVFLPLEMTAKYSINRLIDSRNCFELIQKDFVIPLRVLYVGEASNIIRGWLDKCRNLRQLDFSPNYLIKHNINSAMRGRLHGLILPLSLSN